MKKILIMILCAALLICGAFFAWAMAEGTDNAPAPLVDLTGVVVAVALAAFEFMLAWIAKVIVPPIREWLEAHTTEKEKNLLWDAVTKLVDAAEQTIRGPGQGEKRLAYVEAGLRERGFSIDTDMIEAAVKRMNDRAMAAIGEAFGVTSEIKDAVPVPVNEDGEPDLEISHWNAAQLRSFCELNDIFHDSCVTKEDYIDAIVKAATPLEDSEAPESDTE